MQAEAFAALGSVLSAIAAFLAVVVAWKVWDGQRSLTRELTLRQESLTRDIAQKERVLTQRQLLLPLWQYLCGLSHVDPSNPITPDVLNIVNTLELVALCCEGELIDPKIVKRTFGNRFMELYQEIEQCREIPDLSKSGQAILMETRAATSFYRKLQEEHLARDHL